MSASTKFASTAAPAHIQELETKISSLRKVASDMQGDDFYAELLKIIHHPGWTTEPERLFVEAALQSIEGQLRTMSAMQQQVLKAARLVGN